MRGAEVIFPWGGPGVRDGRMDGFGMFRGGLVGDPESGFAHGSIVALEMLDRGWFVTSDLG